MVACEAPPPHRTPHASRQAGNVPPLPPCVDDFWTGNTCNSQVDPSQAIHPPHSRACRSPLRTAEAQTPCCLLSLLLRRGPQHRRESDRGVGVLAAGEAVPQHARTRTRELPPTVLAAACVSFAQCTCSDSAGSMRPSASHSREASSSRSSDSCRRIWSSQAAGTCCCSPSPSPASSCPACCCCLLASARCTFPTASSASLPTAVAAASNAAPKDANAASVRVESDEEPVRCMIWT
jgi:hypothetical protein